MHNWRVRMIMLESGSSILPMLEKSRLSIILVFPGSSAEHAGLKPHDSACWQWMESPWWKMGLLIPKRVRGPACSAAVFTIQSPGKSPRNVMWSAPPSHLHSRSLPRMVPPRMVPASGTSYLPSFFDETIPGQVKQALQQFGQLDGLILDNRMNQEAPVMLWNRF